MRQKILYIFPIFIIGTMSLIMICFLGGISPQTSLAGVTIEAKKPQVTIANALSGEYQQEYEQWFSQNFPFRSFFIKGYDQVLYALKSPINGVVIGKNGNYLEENYIKYYLGLIPAQDFSIIEEYAENVKIIQDLLEEQDKNFIYIITPSKAELYSETIPNRYWKMKPNFSEPTEHQLLVEALERNQVRYLDLTKPIQEAKATYEYEPFATTGTHWNNYGASIGVYNIIQSINQISDTKLPLPQIKVKKVDKYESYPLDLDIYGLYNIYKGQLDKQYLDVDIAYENPLNNSKQNLFIMGTSFSIQLAELFMKDEGAFNEITRYQYFVERRDYRGEQSIYKELDRTFENSGILDEILNYKTIIMESNVTQIPGSHLEFAKYVKEFLVGEKTDTNLSKKKSDIIMSSNITQISANAGEKIDIPVNIKNNTTLYLNSQETQAVNLSYHIRDEEGNMIIFEGERTIPNKLLVPGDQTDDAIKVVTPNKPGKYILELTIVQENIMWIEEVNNNYPIYIELVVE